MCGIGGVYNPDGNLTKSDARVAKSILNKLQSRGTDAWGVYIFPQDQLYKLPDSLKSFIKDGGTLVGLEKQSGILMHTRAATRGTAKLNKNNHPFMSTTGRFILAHNGHVTNHTNKKSEYDINYDAQTDSAIIVNLIDYLVTHEDMEIISAIEKAAEELIGGKACWLYDRETEEMYLFRVSNPTSYKFVDGTLFFASTERILRNALNDYDYNSVYIHETESGKIYAVGNGKLEEVGSFDKYKSDQWGGRRANRNYNRKNNAWQPSSVKRGDIDIDKRNISGTKLIQPFGIKDLCQFLGIKIDYDEDNNLISIKGEGMKEIYNWIEANNDDVVIVHTEIERNKDTAIKFGLENTAENICDVLYESLMELVGFTELNEIANDIGLNITEASLNGADYYTMGFQLKNKADNELRQYLKGKGLTVGNHASFELNAVGGKKIDNLIKNFRRIKNERHMERA